jgi:hypothetical protein
MIAKACPDITFFAYTKMVKMFKGMREALPKNLNVIFSYGGKWDAMINPAVDHCAMVFENKALAKRAGYKMSVDNMPVSLHDASVRREGFVYHGVMKYENCMKIQTA